MKKLLFLSVLLFSLPSFAGLPEMMKIYNNPNLAPSVKECKGNNYCNGFVALSKQWKDIPNSYRYKGGFNIKHNAKIGDGYGLNKGFYLYQDKSIEFSDVGNEYFYDNGGKPKSKEKVFAQGLAVLLYIEDKNGWTK